MDKFTIEIVSDDPESKEETYIKLYDSFTSGYNNNQTGLGFSGEGNLGKIVIHKGDSYKYVKPDSLSHFESEDWSLGNGGVGNFGDNFKGRTRILKDNNPNKLIRNEELQSYLDDGWRITSNTEGKIAIIIEGKVTYINPDDLEYYRSLGFDKGNHRTCKVMVNDGSKDMMISPEDILDYLSQGWFQGGISNPNKNNIQDHVGINKNGITKFVPGDKVQSYLDDNWILGTGKSSTLGKISINNGSQNKFIGPEHLQDFIDKGWSRGLVKRKHKTN